ncbi:hypothetical protein KP004_14330 [Geomonas oryzisoli]|uniref:Uncharacterized protein n=1 Tax=Geomonas oryzisoli TaxID=2847992 RepID=A0ABX8J5T8_9BACT|nr:hypothetical protein [Geomonas oryzisoli]QWV92377.1 hypothetical protein KP004_14330 [Geomonas oryzisoli]
MGYDLHITRKTFWADDDGPEITSLEWLEAVNKDPSLTLAGYNGDFFVLWTGPSEYEEPWLDWREGEIYSKNPDEAMITKMLEIAGRLGAAVQGDDGEIYTSPTEFHQPEITDTVESIQPKKGWRRFIPW